jgi:hypothetical protein
MSRSATDPRGVSVNAATALLAMPSVRATSGRDVAARSELHKPHAVYPGEPFGPGPSSNPRRVLPTPPGPARVTKRELFSDSPIPLSSRVRPTNEVRDSGRLCSGELV